MLWPTIEVLENEENTTTLRVIMSPFINLIGSIGCGDMNAQYHTSGGVMQTLSLIGVCSAVTSHFRPGYALTKIDAPINFRTAVPIGAPLILKASIVRSRTSVLVIELDGWIEDTGVKLFTQPRRITLKLIPD
jgi:acyl-CoA hydrolase